MVCLPRGVVPVCQLAFDRGHKFVVVVGVTDTFHAGLAGCL